jgi:hypothetical protein
MNNNFLKLFRTIRTPFNNILTQTVRGAKKKGEKKGDVILTEHILNVHKTQDDIAILPDEYYPPWVLNLQHEKTSTEDAFLQMIYGNGVNNFIYRRFLPI